jgi:cbb3-type cytochrome c oxidase subunit III
MKMRKMKAVLGLVLTAGLLPAAMADGADVFRTNCVSCHGKNGQGTPGLAPALKGDKFVTGSSADDVMNTVKNGRAGDQKHFKDLPIAMPAWAGKLSDADIKAVVDYIRGDLQK